MDIAMLFCRMNLTASLELDVDIHSCAKPHMMSPTFSLSKKRDEHRMQHVKVVCSPKWTQDGAQDGMWGPRRPMLSRSWGPRWATLRP